MCIAFRNATTAERQLWVSGERCSTGTGAWGISILRSLQDEATAAQCSREKPAMNGKEGGQRNPQTSSAVLLGLHDFKEQSNYSKIYCTVLFYDLHKQMEPSSLTRTCMYRN